MTDAATQQLVWSHLPKIALMLVVVATLSTNIRRRDAATLGKARPLALAALGLMLFTTLAAPLVSAGLAKAAGTNGPASMWLPYALAGGAFTLIEAIALLLLGLAVLAGRPPR